MLIYRYHPETGEFLFEKEAFPNPLVDGEFLIPANATDVAPMSVGGGEVAVFEEGTWVVKPDNRGATYWLEDGSELKILLIGETLPSNALLAKPSLPTYPTVGAAKLAMAGWIDTFTQNITGPVPQDEKLSWAGKEAAARAYDAGTADAQQIGMIEGEAALTGEVPGALALVIIAKADLYHAIVTQVAGLRRATDVALNEAADPADYETILDGAIVSANDALAVLMSG